MKSLRYLYRIGRGPSSSHTMGPYNAIVFLLNKYQNVKSIDVTLFASLAFTGRGHLTDTVIKEACKDIPCNIVFDYKTDVDFPNTMDVVLHFEDHDLHKRVLSLGGGRVSISDEITSEDEIDVYPEKNLDEIKEICDKNNWSFAQYVYEKEGPEIKIFLDEVYNVMMDAIDRGLSKEGYLPGKLQVKRKAKTFLSPTHLDESIASKGYRLMSGYAFATSEENASGGIIVTAPTCGACGTLPAVIKHMIERCKSSHDEIIDALAVAGLFGNVVKHNGSISGAEAGCQAEIGTACAMAAAAACSLRRLSNKIIECAAEIAIEHSLGLTCDPVDGYVQIPCIERNAISSIKATGASYIAEFVYESQHISFDKAVLTALQTGKDMQLAYRETALGGLATSYYHGKENGKENN